MSEGMNSLRAVLLAHLAACATTVPAMPGPLGMTLAPPEARDSTAVVPAVGTAESEPVPPPPAVVRRPGAYANLDPTDDFVVGPPEPLEDCEGDLKRAGIRFTKFPLPVHTEKQKRSSLVCGAPEVVLYVRGPSKIDYHPAPVVTCAMALALASFERLLEEEATRLFQSPVARIDQLGTYVCREVAAFPGTVSEHSYANAIDIGRFLLKNGRTIEVARDFETTPGDPRKPAGAFLRTISRRANDEDIFSHVLTPFFNATHRNHFHLDLARYRADGTR
jgi:hypothetical protein